MASTMFWAGPTGRLHQAVRCAAKAEQATLTHVTRTDEEVLAVQVGTLCRCAWPSFERARERSGR